MKLNMNYLTLTFLFLNIQGINGKFEIIEDFVSDKRWDFLCLSEHWLSESEIALANINGYHRISMYTRSRFKHGGTVIYALEDISCMNLDVKNFSCDKHFEVCAFIMHSAKVIGVNIYRTPTGDINIFLSNLYNLLTYLIEWSAYKIVLGGDINSGFDITTNKRSVIDFINLLSQFGFRCYNNKCTRGNACLDNVFANIPVQNCSVHVHNFYFSDHSALCFNISLVKSNDQTACNNKFVTYRNFSFLNYDKFQQILTRIDWNLYLFNTYFTAQEIFDVFFNIFCGTFNECFTKKSVLKNKIKNNKILFSSELRQLKIILTLSYNVYKQTGSEIAKKSYYLQRKSYRQKIKDIKLTKNIILIENSNNKSKTAWSLINKFRNGASNKSVVPLSAEDLSSHFVNVIEETKSKIDKPKMSHLQLLNNSERPKANLIWKEVTTSQVLDIVENLKHSNSTDIYDISNTFFKENNSKYCIPSYLLY